MDKLQVVVIISSSKLRLTFSGAIKLCAGQNSGSEAGVHALKLIFADTGNEAVQLVDATNAFNCLNRQVALRNIQINCPAVFPILLKTYHQPSRLFVNRESLWSKKEHRRETH